MFGGSKLSNELVAKIVCSALGGKENITNIDCCFTKLRVELKNIDIVNRKEILETGAKDVIVEGEDQIHIVYGPIVSKVMDELKNLLNK